MSPCTIWWYHTSNLDIIFHLRHGLKLGKHSCNQRCQKCLINSCTRLQCFFGICTMSLVTSGANIPPIWPWRLQPKRFSSWRRLIWTYTWVMRFISNCYTTKDNSVLDNELKIEEIVDAENCIIRTAQSQAFSDEYTALLKGRKLSSQSKLLRLFPWLDDNKIMRSDSRLKYAEFLPYDVRYPIILPRKNWVTKLIVKHHHVLGNHNAGTN